MEISKNVIKTENLNLRFNKLEYKAIIVTTYQQILTNTMEVRLELPINF